ncbi:MAG: exodeoxyribonuclease V subunit alpha [Xanthomonadaceae bacterium]|jgi:exodeoxyribonuclease V alpha subunit|nr:exodeoxyribonuclease V subunit alpha [Xanthomonadaceae bacterium]
MTALDALRKLHRQQTLREVDIAFAELLHRSGGSDATMLAGALAMRAVALGHSGFALEQAALLLEELDADAMLPETDAWAAALGEDPLVATPETMAAGNGDGPPRPLRPLALVDGRVSLYRYADYERTLARQLLRRHRSAIPPEADGDPALRALAMLFGASPQNVLSDPQARAVRNAWQRRLTLVTGGPGTGKTTIVARLLALLLRSGIDPQRVALAAPTGRAAARLGEAIVQAVQRDVDGQRLDAASAERIPHETRTLHRLLGWRPGRVGFRHDAIHRLPFDVVIVDEASMIDLPLMSRLLDAVADDARLILLGDPDQLPAVEAGHVFGALSDAAADEEGDAETGPGSLSVPQASKPLAAARVHLSRSYRQSEAPALTTLARCVQAGDIDAAKRLLMETDDSLAWHRGGMAELQGWMRRQWLPALREMGHAADPAAALAQARQGRILTALRHGPFGAETWNAWFAHQLGGATQRWFHGQLLMVTANSYRHGLFNGDTGIVWHDAQGEPWVWFENLQHPWHPSQLPAHESAFASTVHKAQGSEFERVALLLPDRDSRALGRELLYTGLTRARRRVDLWASEEMLGRTIARRRRRDTGLASWLKRSEAEDRHSC